MRKSLKRFVSGVLIFVLVLTSVPVSLDEVRAQGASRTILVYGCGADIESYRGRLSENLRQMMRAPIPSGVNVLVLTGGSEEWMLEEEYLKGADHISGERNQLWLLSGAADEGSHGTMKFLGDLPVYASSYMTNPRTLKAFLDYGKANYPAELYDLILWDHGGGPVDGFGLDERDREGKTMSVPDMVRAIRDSSIEKFELIDFDACLMGNVEIITVLSDYADNVVSSAEIMPSYGQEYTGWLTALSKKPSMDGYELGRHIVDSTVSWYEKKHDALLLTMSVVNIPNFKNRLLPELIRLTDRMFSEVDNPGQLNNRINFYDELFARKCSICYDNGNVPLYDLGNLAMFLGICFSEYENTKAENDPEMRNYYTDISMAITEIMEDHDFSGDDVIYAAHSEVAKKMSSEVYGRNRDGSIDSYFDTITPSGLSVEFAMTTAEPGSAWECTKYIKVMEEMRRLPSDGDARMLLENLELVSAAYSLIMSYGYYVSYLFETTGRKRISDRLIRNVMDEDILNVFLSTIDTLSEYDSDDVDDWLSFIAAQQSAEAVLMRKTSAMLAVNSLEEDCYQVTLENTYLREVSKLELRYCVSADSDPDNWRDQIVLAGEAGVFSLDYAYRSQKNNIDPLRLRYQDSSTVYLVKKPSVTETFAFVDAEGKAHMFSVDRQSEMRDGRIYIPVSLREVGDPDTEEDGWLVGNELSGGEGIEIIGYRPRSQNSALVYPIYDIMDSYFKDTEICPYVEHLRGEMDSTAEMKYTAWKLQGDYIPLTDDPGRGLVVKKVPLSTFGFREDQFHTYGCVTDIYGFEHNITPHLVDADASPDKVRVDIGHSDVKVKVSSPVYTGKALKPKIVISYKGRVLKENVDYEVDYPLVVKAQYAEVIIWGKGDFSGLRVQVFEIRQATSRISVTKTIPFSKLKKAAQTAVKISTLAKVNKISVSTSQTPKALRKYIAISADRKTIRLKKGAKKGKYKITVTVSGGSSKTYSNLKKKTYQVTVK